MTRPNRASRGSVTIATTAVETPMGAQAYQEAIATRAQAALSAVRPGAPVKRSISRSMRSPLPGTMRLPTGLLTKASTRTRRMIGRVAYRGGGLVHRMDLLLPPPPGPDIVTLHDVVAWRSPDEAPPAAAAPEELRRADSVICVSAFTAGEAADFFGLTNTVVVPNGVDERYFDPVPMGEARRQELGLRTPYILYAGGSASRKNLPGLASAWRAVAALRPDWTRALSGPRSEQRERLFAELPRVVHLGRLPDEDMAPLLAGAEAAVVPSTYEGFGLPALEAMAAGIPLVSSNTSSLPEVVGDGGLLVDPTADGLAEGLLEVTGGGREVAERATRGAARAREFTWDRSAEGHAEVWARFL